MQKFGTLPDLETPHFVRCLAGLINSGNYVTNQTGFQSQTRWLESRAAEKAATPPRATFLVDKGSAAVQQDFGSSAPPRPRTALACAAVSARVRARALARARRRLHGALRACARTSARARRAPADTQASAGRRTGAHSTELPNLGCLIRVRPSSQTLVV